MRPPLDRQPAVMPERLVQAAVKAGLDAVGYPLTTGGISEQASRLALILAVSDDWSDDRFDDGSEEPVSDGSMSATRLQADSLVVGFDSPSAEGMGDVPWYAD